MEEREGKEKENNSKKRKRALRNKKIIYLLQLVNSAVSNLRSHYSLMPKIMAFTMFDGSAFLEVGVSNAKYLAFNTLDKNALSIMCTRFLLFYY